MRLTIDKLNDKYRASLKNRIIGGKNRFGWYTAYLLNGRIAVGSTLIDLDKSIENNL